MKDLVISVSDKSGVSLHKVKVSGKKLSIGRGWNSDVILQDKFVDPDHLNLTLDEGGVLMLADMGSTNGTSLAGKHLRGEAKAYRLGDPIKLGDTRLTIFDQSAGVEPTSIRSSWFLMADKFKSFPALFVLTLLTLAMSIFSHWLFLQEPLDASGALLSGATTLLVIVLCSFILGFISKLTRGESNVRALWVLACLGVILVELVLLVLLVLRFNMQNFELANSLSTVVLVLVASWLLVGVFTYTSHLTARYKWLWSALVVMTVYGVANSDQLLKKDHQKWNASTSTEDTTLPPAFLWRSGASIEEYQQQTGHLFDFELSDPK